MLRAMHRGYRRGAYLHVCAELRTLDPDTEFTSDVMVGFPGESADDHASTLALIAETEMLAAHAFRYSPRPETLAAALPGRVDDQLARRRSAEVRRATEATGRARRLRAVGRRHWAVWDRVEDGVAHGLTATYLEVLAPASSATMPGELTTVVAETLGGGALRARLVEP